MGSVTCGRYLIHFYEFEINDFPYGIAGKQNLSFVDITLIIQINNKWAELKLYSLVGLVPLYRLHFSRMWHLTLVRSYSQSLLCCDQNAPPRGQKHKTVEPEPGFASPPLPHRRATYLWTSDSSLQSLRELRAMSVSIRGVLLNLSPGIRVFPVGFHLDFSTVIGQKLPIIFVSFFFKDLLPCFKISVKRVCGKSLASTG